MRRNTVLLLVLILLCSAATAARAEVLLYDTFDEGIDTSVWSTPVNAYSSNSKTQWVSGAAQLQKRSILATVKDFDPAEYGGLSITGDPGMSLVKNSSPS